MTDHPIRFFADDAAIRRVGEGLLDRTLPRVDWTHEAHLAATAYLILERFDIDLDRAIADIIRGYNAAVGGVNDHYNGYHDTITRASLAGVRSFLATHRDGGLCERINALLASPVGRRDWLLGFYSRERLFTIEARRAFVKPDLAPLPSLRGA